jgi:exosortase
MIDYFGQTLLLQGDSMEGNRVKLWGRVGLAVALLILFYAPTFSALFKTWWGSDVYSHGLLIVPISLYLVWTKRADWGMQNPNPNLFCGVFVLVLSMGMFLLGRFGNIITLEALSFIITVIGIVLLILGRPFLKATRFPIAYLLFMIPIDRLLLQKVHWPLQLFSAQMGTSLLNLFGFPAFLQGEYIQLSNITLEVAKACSGLNYLTAIIAVGMPLAYLSLKNIKWQLALVLSAVIIAILANGVRVAFAGILGSLGHAIHGPLHILEGVVIAWIGFIALFFGAWLFAGIESRAY